MHCDTAVSQLNSTVHCPSTGTTADHIGPSGHHSPHASNHVHSVLEEEKIDHVSESTTPVSDTTEGTSTLSDVEMGDSNQSHAEQVEVVIENPETITAS